jgi:hypothetical protein
LGKQVREEFHDVLFKVRDRRLRIKKYGFEINHFDFPETIRDDIQVDYDKPMQMFLVTDNGRSLYTSSLQDTKLYYYK